MDKRTLDLAVQAGVITEQQREEILTIEDVSLTESAMACINILHQYFCPLDHEKDCFFYLEEARTECWDLPAHKTWQHVYMRIKEELQPVDDNDLLMHLSRANELFNEHETVQVFVAFNVLGIPEDFFTQAKEEEEDGTVQIHG